jgi:exodeoxyribonuclease VII small subunit
MSQEDISYEKMRSIEEDDLTLEQVIAAVAEGTRYLRICYAKLDDAKHKIEVRPEATPVPAEAPVESPPEDRLL